MFKFWKRNKEEGPAETALDASAIFEALTWAQQQISEDRIPDRLDASLTCGPQLAVLNRFVGRPVGSFQAVTFAQVIDRVRHLNNTEVFPQLLKTISSSVPLPFDAIILAAAFYLEFERRTANSKSSKVQNQIRDESTTLLRRLNEFSSG